MIKLQRCQHQTIVCSFLLFHWSHQELLTANRPFSQLFPLAVSSRTTYIISYVRTTNYRLYSNISQKCLLYKTWGFYNKFESMKSLGLCYWYVKMPRCGCVEYGLEYITFYVQKHITPLVALFWFPAGSRRVVRGARICETALLWIWRDWLLCTTAVVHWLSIDIHHK